jgi:hypothetical protein
MSVHGIAWSQASRRLSRCPTALRFLLLAVACTTEPEQEPGRPFDPTQDSLANSTWTLQDSSSVRQGRHVLMCRQTVLLELGASSPSPTGEVVTGTVGPGQTACLFDDQPYGNSTTPYFYTGRTITLERAGVTVTIRLNADTLFYQGALESTRQMGGAMDYAAIFNREGQWQATRMAAGVEATVRP